MDEQTRMARFESMRTSKVPGRMRFSKNKKLFLKHKELEKICANEIRRHEFDTKVATVDIKQQQLLLEKKQEKLKQEQVTCAMSREKTQLFHAQQDEIHLTQQTRSQTAMAAVRAEDIVTVVRELHMPNYMRRRLLEHHANTT